MTIAACYLSPEGVVLGVDSTSTIRRNVEDKEEYHHFNYGQKLFEVGQNGSLAIANWGLASLGQLNNQTSYRTLIARFSDSISSQRPQSVIDAAWHWNTLFWGEYCSAFAELRVRAQELYSKGDSRSHEESEELRQIWQISTGGFCIGGVCRRDRQPEAYEIQFRPEWTSPAPPTPLMMGQPRFWAWSNMMERVLYGCDERFLNAIINSGKWSGTQDELIDLIRQQSLRPPLTLPIREAVDWVYSAIYTTIKAIKFSKFDPVCGGPVEIAVITTDRQFRWIKHKEFDSAITNL